MDFLDLGSRKKALNHKLSAKRVTNIRLSIFSKIIYVFFEINDYCDYVDSYQ